MDLTWTSLILKDESLRFFVMSESTTNPQTNRNITED